MFSQLGKASLTNKEKQGFGNRGPLVSRVKESNAAATERINERETGLHFLV